MSFRWGKEMGVTEISFVLYNLHVGCETESRKDVTDSYVQTHQRRKAEARGIPPLGTSRGYLALAASMPEAKLRRRSTRLHAGKFGFGGASYIIGGKVLSVESKTPVESLSRSFPPHLFGLQFALGHALSSWSLACASSV